MTNKFKSYLTVIATIAILLPVAAFADNQKGDGKKEGKGGGGGEGGGHGHSGNGAVSQAASARVSVPTSGKSHGNGGSRGGGQGAATMSARVGGASASSGAVRQSSVVTGASSRRSGRSAVRSQSAVPAVAPAPGQGNQSQTGANQQSYTQSNNYGGLWFAPDTHSDWNRDQQHFYDNHNYRWYNNGWLITDSGYSPYSSSRSSTAASVQKSLTREGYYHGPIDGDVGPGTRQAIAQYQGDNGLRVTGHINTPLIQSLQLN